jgi:hypothetical protein
MSKSGAHGVRNQRRFPGVNFIVVGLMFVGLLALLLVDTALAHTRVEVGPYTLILGWELEPVIVGERNALVLEVLEGETPVTGLEGTLRLEVLYAGRTFIGNLAPTSTPGLYQAEIFPTVRGQYEVQLTGTIEGLAVDEFLKPEEVLPARVLQFPESQPDLAEVQASITALEGQLQTAVIIGGVGILVGLLGLVLAVLGLRRSTTK